MQTATLTGPRVWAGKTTMPCQIPAAWWRVTAVDRTRRKYTKRSAGKSHLKFTIVSSNFTWANDSVSQDRMLLLRVASGLSSSSYWKTWSGSELSALLLESQRYTGGSLDFLHHPIWYENVTSELNFAWENVHAMLMQTFENRVEDGVNDNKAYLFPFASGSEIQD